MESIANMENKPHTIPEEYLKMAQSPELYDACEKIGEKYGLMLDQVGELDAEIADVVVGSSNSKEFTSNIQKRMGISRDVAEKITADVNAGVMQFIRSHFQKKSVGKENTELEKAGEFTIEHPGVPPKSNENVSYDDKNDILSAIENPESIGREMKKPAMLEHETFTEPLSDQLLDAPPSNPEKKPKGPDMYREPWE